MMDMRIPVLEALVPLVVAPMLFARLAGDGGSAPAAGFALHSLRILL